MKKQFSVVVLFILTLVFVITPTTSAAQLSQSAPAGCSGGKWTPDPVSELESGDAISPAFHTIWGYACKGNIYMVRLSNKVNGNIIDISVLKQMALGCTGGSWSPKPVSKFDSGSPTSPAFHVIWGYVCGDNMYMIRFTNKLKDNNGNPVLIDVSSLGNTPLT